MTWPKNLQFLTHLKSLSTGLCTVKQLFPHSEEENVMVYKPDKYLSYFAMDCRAR